MQKVMPKINKYLAYGGGVNSTALMLLLLEQGVKFEALFADHGGDYPETYEYVNLLITKGYQITIIKTRRKGLTLPENYEKAGAIPSRLKRWCTQDFKITPMRKYYKYPYELYIGFDYGEKHRAIKMVERDADYCDNKEIQKIFPLVELKIDRIECKKIIQKAGLPIPPKSGCWLCPFQSSKNWKELKRLHPELYCRAKRLEAISIERAISKGKKPMYLYSNKPLDIIVKEKQEDFWEKPCLCSL